MSGSRGVLLSNTIMVNSSTAYSSDPDSLARMVPGSRGFDVRRAALASVIWMVVLANGGVIVWLWWNGGNVTGVHTTGDIFNSVGRLTGLLSAYSALIQVLLLARLPVLERISGFDRLSVWHRWNGKLCLYLVLAHVGFIIVGYALNDRISIPSETSTMILNYPGMIAATVGTGMLVVVVISSFVIARRRLPYEAWYAIHITVYGALALAWFHQIPTGNELVLNQAAADYWQSLYLATIALLVFFRVLQPVFHVLRHRMEVSKVVVEGPGVVSIHMTGRRLDRLGAFAGQFFLWRFLTWGRFWQAHPFSLSSAPDGESLRITVKDLGGFTGRIGEIRPGTKVIAEGPFGRFTDQSRRRDRVALIAGGIGITPIRALLEQMGGDLVLIYRVLREEDLVFRGEIEQLAHARGIEVFFVVGDHREPGGEGLMSPQHLRHLVPDLARREIFTCGPPAMVRIIERNLREAGVPRRHLHIENFAL